MDLNMILETLSQNNTHILILLHIIGVQLVIMIMLGFKVFNLTKYIATLQRKLEKSSVSTEESSDKVKLLEDKIKTLETALNQALKK